VKKCKNAPANFAYGYTVLAYSARPSFFSKNAPHKSTVIEMTGGSVAEWLECWTQAQKGPDSNRSRDAVG